MNEKPGAFETVSAMLKVVWWLSIATIAICCAAITGLAIFKAVL